MRTLSTVLLASLLGCTGTMLDSGPGPDPDPDPDPTPVGDVTYHQDVAPLIAENCLGCHAEGGPQSQNENRRGYRPARWSVRPGVHLDASLAAFDDLRSSS